MQQTGSVDAAGGDAVAVLDLDRHGLAGDGGSIDAALAFGDDAVQGDSIARAHNQDIPDLSLAGGNLLRTAVRNQFHHFWAHIHSIHNLTSTFLHRSMLEVFAHSIKQHDAHRLGKVADGQRAHSSRAHQKVFVKHMASSQVFAGRQQHLPA